MKTKVDKMPVVASGSVEEPPPVVMVFFCSLMNKVTILRLLMPIPVLVSVTKEACSDVTL